MAVAKDRKFAVPFVRAALTLAAMPAVAEQRDRQHAADAAVLAPVAVELLPFLLPNLCSCCCFQIFSSSYIHLPLA